MIKGKVIVQRDTINRPQVNYRELGALNVSMIKLFDTDPVKFFETFKLGKKKKAVKNVSTKIGDLVDFYLLDCKGDESEFDLRVDEKFALFEENKGSGQAFILADELFEIAQENTDENGVIMLKFESMFSDALKKVQANGKYSGKTEEKALEDFEKKALSYYDFLIENADKVVVDESLINKAKKVGNLLKDDEFTADLFNDDDANIENFPKFVIEWKYTTKSGKVIDCKSEVDLIKVDHKNKIIYPKDLKTTYDNENFEYTYLKFRYDLQAAFYTLAIKYWANEEGLNEYIVKPFEFIVGDTSANNRRPVRYQLDIKDVYAGLDGFTLRGNEYKGIHQLIEDISWAEDTDNWNVSKQVIDAKGILKLNLKYE